MGMIFRLNKTPNQIIDQTMGGEKTQLFLANETKKLMQPYVPELNHMLVKLVDVYADAEGGMVHYRSPYARFQFGGKVMVSSKTGSSWSHGESKVLTDRDLRYTKPTATSHWDRAMLVARKADLTKAVQNYIKGGSK